MSLPRSAIAASILLAALVACGDDEDVNAGYQQVTADHEAIKVAVLPDDGGDDGAGGAATLTLLGVSEDLDAPVATVSLSHTYVPAEWGAYDSAVDERMRVLVVVEDAYIAKVDRGDIQIDVGDGTTIASIELEQDALTPSHFFVFLKPSCAVESRNAEGVCQIDSSATCTVSLAEGGPEELQGRCDAFKVRLWAYDGDTSDDTATPAGVSAGRLDRGRGWSALPIEMSAPGAWRLTPGAEASGAPINPGR